MTAVGPLQIARRALAERGIEATDARIGYADIVAKDGATTVLVIVAVEGVRTKGGTYARLTLDQALTVEATKMCHRYLADTPACDTVRVDAVRIDYSESEPKVLRIRNIAHAARRSHDMP